ncbi:MAG: hypothetical protein JWN70_287 [Planctomycetaceae bacterium]|nr:hypothetical protein [Planctomycetaceae bacterium]
MRNLLSKLGLIVEPAKRISKPRQGWGIQTEQLEDRALLSAATCNMPDPGVKAHVSHADQKAMATFPNVAGHWNVTVTGQVSGTGTIDVVQSGKKHNKITTTVHVAGVPTFETSGTFKAKTPFSLSGSSPKLELPGFPIPVKLTLTITFPAGNLNPTTFTGTVTAPFVGTVATISGLQDNSP